MRCRGAEGGWGAAGVGYVLGRPGRGCAECCRMFCNEDIDDNTREKRKTVLGVNQSGLYGLHGRSVDYWIIVDALPSEKQSENPRSTTIHIFHNQATRN